MDHLGLRIYRFYIKCTACLSEISFRTDPANTDYVLEAGANRNFEALSKAEKQAEAEEKAHQEELKNNPMKMLEERTEASKNEMERMEALEELQELNKRNVKIDYDSMLGTYDKIRADEVKKQEDEDEAFISQVFGKGPSGSKVKRILDEGSSSEDDDGKPKTRFFKKFKSATDILGEEPPKPNPSKEKSYQKSIGRLVTKKNALVKPKSSKSTPAPAPPEEKKPSSLGLIADYSDSSENDE